MNNQRQQFYYGLLIALLLLSVVTIILGISMGSVTIPLNKIWQVLFDDTFNEMTMQRIIWDLRLPRVIAGYLVGVTLALTGIAMQVCVGNQLADPFILGISSGASFFATLSMVFGIFSLLGTFALPLSAFIGALIAMSIVMFISRMGGTFTVTRLLLSGVVVSMIFDALTKYTILSAPNALGIHNTEFWLSGSLANVDGSMIKLLSVMSVIFSMLMLILYRHLNLLSLGATHARVLGVNVKQLQMMLVVMSSLMTGMAIAVSGIVGFVGMIGPHISRRLVGNHHLKLIPIAMLVGGNIVVLADILARLLIKPAELPLGILTAIIGGPIFILLMMKEKGVK